MAQLTLAARNTVGKIIGDFMWELFCLQQLARKQIENVVPPMFRQETTAS
ncbi:MAG: hypothetical protein ACI9R3_002427 [Verrucomicrobiales bacterium]|jgi:hypothetical protein